MRFSFILGGFLFKLVCLSDIEAHKEIVIVEHFKIFKRKLFRHFQRKTQREQVPKGLEPHLSVELYKRPSKRTQVSYCKELFNNFEVSHETYMRRIVTDSKHKEILSFLLMSRRAREAYHLSKRGLKLLFFFLFRFPN